MEIKSILYNVGLGGVAPSTEQFAGVQGDHNVTRLNFEISDDLYDLLSRNFSDEKLMYRFDVYNGEGGIWQSEPKMLENKNVDFSLEEKHTRYGGKIVVYLVITVLSQNDETQLEAYSFSVVLRLRNKPNGTHIMVENYDSVTSLAEMAKSSAIAAEKSNQELQQLATEVSEKLENAVDTIYSPNSQNAQSGIAVAEAIGTCVAKVDGNGHTDQVYVVDSVGQQRTVEIEDTGRYMFGGDSFGGCLPRRQTNGNLATYSPVNEFDCVNKKYVDDLIGDIETLLGGI